MHPVKKLIVTAALLTSTALASAQLSLKLETIPTTNVGALKTEELGPVFAHPLPEEQTPAPQAAPQVAEKQLQKSDIQNLFQDDKPKEQKNPLEEEAKNELKALDGPDAKAPELVLGEEKKPSEVLIKAENAPREIDLDGTSPDSTSLPTILKQQG